MRAGVDVVLIVKKFLVCREGRARSFAYKGEAARPRLRKCIVQRVNTEITANREANDSQLYRDYGKRNKRYYTVARRTAYYICESIV